MPETTNRFSFDGDWTAEQLDQFASNRGFESRAKYFRYLIKQDIQRQISESDFTVVPNDE